MYKLALISLFRSGGVYKFTRLERSSEINAPSTELWNIVPLSSIVGVNIDFHIPVAASAQMKGLRRRKVTECLQG